MSAFVTFMPAAPAAGNALTPSRRSRAPSPVFILHPSPVALLLETCMVAARMSITPCFSHARYNPDLEYQRGALSALPSTSISVCCTPDSPATINPHVHEIHDVHKCTPFYCQLLPPLPFAAPEPRRKWPNVAHSDAPRRWPFFILHPSSFPVWGNVGDYRHVAPEARCLRLNLGACLVYTLPRATMPVGSLLAIPTPPAAIAC
jgi:hypothetical protein